jgi:hypothetical protein
LFNGMLTISKAVFMGCFLLLKLGSGAPTKRRLLPAFQF